MNLADTLRGLWRRWYIVIPGLILTIVVAIAALQAVKPDYERTGTQLLLPGTASIPEKGNPYLYLGDLSQAADVLITAMSSESELNSLLKGHPGAEIVIIRDPLTPAPQILTTVTARTDEEAAEILEATIATTRQQLGQLQNIDGITSGNRIGIKSITVDNHSTLVQKTRVLIVGGAALAMLLITLLTAGLVEGLSKRRRATVGVRGTPSADDPVDDDDNDDDEDDSADDGDRSSPGAADDRRATGRPLTRRRRPVSRRVG